MKSLSVCIGIAVALIQAGLCQSPPSEWRGETVATFKAPEARQGVAVDGTYFYAISNREIGKYRKDTGVFVTRWKDEAGGPFVHLNADIVKEGKLYAAHSNYPGLPMKSSVEVWDASDLTHVESYELGDTDGSLTWIDEHDGFWYAGFAHYDGHGGLPGHGTKYSRIVKYDRQWKTMQEWTYPEPLIQRFAGDSASCGQFWPDGKLFITGHDAKEIYILAFPREGSVMQWVGTIPVPFAGQGFAADPSDGGMLYGISRKEREVIAVRLAESTAPAQKPANSPSPRKTSPR